MKEDELRRHAKCNMCGKRIGESGVPLFWVVKVQRFGVDMNAIKRQDGLSAFLGSTMLGSIMGPDQEMATPVMDELKITVCDTCGTEHTCVAHLSEVGLK